MSKYIRQQYPNHQEIQAHAISILPKFQNKKLSNAIPYF